VALVGRLPAELDRAERRLDRALGPREVVDERRRHLDPVGLGAEPDADAGEVFVEPLGDERERRVVQGVHLPADVFFAVAVPALLHRRRPLK